MNITEKIVQKLLGLLDEGLCHGAGHHYRPGDFCVQQAVNRATTSDEERGDHPNCINPTVCRFGIQLNDVFNGSSHDRAKILKRFAVAELGSRGTIDGSKFMTRHKEIWKERNPGKQYPGWRPNNSRYVQEYADIAVDVLTELGSPGVQYLYMCDPGAKLKPEHEEALNKEQELKKKFDSMTKWKGFGTELGTQKKATNQ